MAATTWLRCRVSPGQFSAEYAVEIKDFRGKEFSLFVPDNFVECNSISSEKEIAEGWLQVEVLNQQDKLALIQLPRAPFENGPTVTVKRCQLDYRTVSICH